MLKKILPKLIGSGLNLYSLLAPERAGAITLNLFSTPREGRLKEVDLDFLSQADKQFLLPTAHGKVKSYVWNTEAPQTILLLHGWESNTARWALLIEKLLPLDYCIVSIDAPAHGASDGKQFNMIKYSEAIAAITQQYQPDFMIGHSLGGATLCYYLTHYQQNINLEKIVLLGAPSELTEMMGGGFAQALGLSNRTIQGLYLFFEKKFNKPPSYFSSSVFSQSIPFPTLVIHDRKDLIVGVAAGKSIHAALPDSEILLTNGLGHSLQDNLVFHTIIDFFGKN